MFPLVFLKKLISNNEVTAGLCVLILTFLITAFIRKVKSKYPPGPWGLPILGYLPFMTNRPYLKFIELGKKYGDVFSINLGYRRLVVLNSADAAREALTKNEFLGRPPFGVFHLFKKASPFFSSPVSVWQEQRRFVVQSMKDLGLGKSKIEEHIKDEITTFLEVLKSREGKPMDLSIPLAPSMSNNINALVFGVRHDYNDPIRKKLDQNARNITAYLQQTGLIQLFPWLSRLPFLKNDGMKTALASFEESLVIFRKMIAEHKETLDPQNVRDYVDSYLLEMESRKQKLESRTTLNEGTLVGSATDLFAAGSETVFTTILWCIYIVAAYPDIQKRVQKEIADVIGSDRMAEFSDQKSMPFTHAAIMEVLRFVSILPLNILHYSTTDTMIGGYEIPKGTAVVANFWAIHHDPKHWEDPHDFKPERFLSPDKKSVVKPPNYMPFSLGKRVCPGENMAYMEVFLYFVSILQKYNVAFPDGTKPTFRSDLGITLKPEEYDIIFLSKS